MGILFFQQQQHNATEWRNFLIVTGPCLSLELQTVETFIFQVLKLFNQ